MKFRRLTEAFDNEEVFVNDTDPIPADAGISKDELEEAVCDEDNRYCKLLKQIEQQESKALNEGILDIILNSTFAHNMYKEMYAPLADAIKEGDYDKARNMYDEYMADLEEFKSTCVKQHQKNFCTIQSELLSKYKEQIDAMNDPVPVAVNENVEQDPETSKNTRPNRTLAETLDSDEHKIERYETDIDELYKFMMNKTHTDYMEGRLAADKYAEFLKSVYDALDAVTMPEDKVEECVESEPVVEATEGKRQFKPHTIRLLKLIGSDLVEGIEDPEENKEVLDEGCTDDCKEQQDTEELEEEINSSIDDDYNIQDESDVECTWDDYDDEYSMDPVEQDRAHAALYGGDREYCECGEKLEHDEWGGYCPVCNPKVDN